MLKNYLLNGKIQIDSCGCKRRKGGNEEILFTYFIQNLQKEKKRSQQLEKEKGGARGERVRAGRRRQGKGRNGR